MDNKDFLGLMFQNKKKFSDKSPDYKGSVLVDGKVYNVSLWEKVGKTSGNKFFSIALNEPKEKVEKKEEKTDKTDFSNHPFPEEVKEVSEAFGGNMEILDDKPLGEDDTPF